MPTASLYAKPWRPQATLPPYVAEPLVGVRAQTLPELTSFRRGTFRTDSGGWET